MIETLRVWGIILLLMLSTSACNYRFDSTSGKSTPSVSLREANITVEVADNFETRAKGLSGRSSLDSNTGMIFVFDQTGIPSFWMKDMKFALDFIWLRNAVVVDIAENVPPPAAGTPDGSLERYGPSDTVDSVIEVNAGFVARHGIKVGDQVTLNLGR